MFKNCVLEQSLQILGNAVTRQHHILTSDVKWQEVYELLKKNNVANCCYNYINSLPIEERPDDTLMNEWKNLDIYQNIRQLVKLNALMIVLKAALEKNIELIIFKGIVLADLYPCKTERVSSDTDILVQIKDVDEISRVLLDLGYLMKPQKENVQVYVLPNKHIIELHTSLWEDYQGCIIDKLEQLNLTQNSKLLSLTACGISITTLGYTQHLIYLIYHIVKHFCLEGTGIKCLLDISLYVNAWNDKINWTDFWLSMKSLQYDQFCRKIFYLCGLYFGMKHVIDMVDYQLCEEEIEYLLRDFMLLTREELGEHKAEYEALRIVEPYFCDGKGILRNRMLLRLRFLFPIHFYEKKYQYANKNKLLLPVAWVERAKHYRKRIKIEDKVSLNKKFNKAKQRIEMMELTGLIKFSKQVNFDNLRRKNGQGDRNL